MSVEREINQVKGAMHGTPGEHWAPRECVDFLLGERDRLTEKLNAANRRVAGAFGPTPWSAP